MVDENTHIPVMIEEVLKYLAPVNGAVYIDGTFGGGGYTSKILETTDCSVIAFDRDENVLPCVEKFNAKYKNRFTFFQEKFSNILPTLIKNNIQPVEGLVLDIGVSSMQIDNPLRGFSFRFDAPLSMAMGENEFDAGEVINNFSEEELSDIFFKYGEEPRSRAIAKRIILNRGVKPFKTTLDLVNLIENMYGEWQASKIIPRVFQAIRIFVNDELCELESVLADTYNILKPSGRLVVVDFHSLEDRIVKNFIKENTKLQGCKSRYLPEINPNDTNQKIIFKNIEKNVILPLDEELKNNPRARSAKLRVVEKI